MKSKIENGGLFFTEGTAPQVINAIKHAHAHGLRVRVFYGDTVTGAAWPEEFDIVGKIGKSTGVQKIPLLINNARSMGGGALLDHCIVGVALTNGGGWLYKHPSFKTGEFLQVPPVSPGYAEAVAHNGTLHAQFKKPGQAARYCQFMRGERFAK